MKSVNSGTDGNVQVVEWVRVVNGEVAERNLLGDKARERQRGESNPQAEALTFRTI